MFLLITGQFNPELLLLVTIFGNLDSGKRDDLGLAILLLGVVKFFLGDFEGEVTFLDFLAEETLSVLLKNVSGG